MYDYNPPMNNNTMGYNMSPGQFQAAPNPVGNIMNIGSMGYNNNMGSYYGGGNYNNFYNPYLAAKQQEIAEAKAMEAQRQQVDVLKMISRKANASLGNQISEEELNRLYDTNPEVNPYIETENRYMRLANLHYTAPTGNPYYQRQIELNNAMYDRAKEYMPDDTTIYQFGEKVSPILEEIVMNEYRNKQRNDVNRLYNSSEYKQLTSMHANTNNYFASMWDNNAPGGEVTIDDMKVELPNHLAQTYAQKKAEFMRKILER